MRPAWESGAGFSALAIAGVLALNYPLLALFDLDTSVFGIPLPFLHVFVVWALLIAGLAVLAEYRGKRDSAAGTLRKRDREHGDGQTANDDAAPVSGLRHDMED